MANYIITQDDINIVNQNVKELFVKIELLNKNFKVIYSFEGNLISDSFSISSDSNVRRTYSVELVVNDSSLFVGADKKIWMDKYIRPYVGIKNVRTKEIQWYLKGTYTMLDLNYSYNQTTNTLSLSCSDLMSELNGERNGVIKDSITISEDAIPIFLLKNILSIQIITAVRQSILIKTSEVRMRFWIPLIVCLKIL
jgi:hypothetical protein